MKKAILTAVLLSACATSAEGETCTKTGDCKGGLSCVAQRCVDVEKARAALEAEAAAEKSKRDDAFEALTKQITALQEERASLERQIEEASTDAERASLQKKLADLEADISARADLAGL